LQREEVKEFLTIRIGEIRTGNQIVKINLSFTINSSGYHTDGIHQKSRLKLFLIEKKGLFTQKG